MKPPCRTAPLARLPEPSERTEHPRDAVEAALAHVVGDRTAAACPRSDLFANAAAT